MTFLSVLDGLSNFSQQDPYILVKEDFFALRRTWKTFPESILWDHLLGYVTFILDIAWNKIRTWILRKQAVLLCIYNNRLKKGFYFAFSSGEIRTVAFNFRTVS